MAELWRLTAGDGAPYLLKVPRSGFGCHPACYAGFEVERVVLGRLSGSHVPRLVADGEDEEGPWLVLEEIPGPSLADLAARAPLAAAEAARLGAALASALHALHRQDVVHHDLKPVHVLFRPGGEAVLIDFGLACHGQLPDLVETESDHPLGTPAYISPEQLAGRRGDPRSDIFALGVILYQLATGRLPFGAPESAAGMRRRLYLDPPPPRRLRPEIPDWLQEVILRCLAVRAENRYATAALVAHDLAHPEQVPVTGRGRHTQNTSWRTLLRRAWQAHFGGQPPPAAPARHLARTPHVLAAIDTDPAHDALAQALRDAVRHLIDGCGQGRLTCATVFAPGLSAGGEDLPELARSEHTRRLVELHHWARDLALPPERLRFVVLPGTDAAAALIGYARAQHVDHIVMGARGSSALRRFLGSVSSRVVAETPCTVTVVRAQKAGDSTPQDAVSKANRILRVPG
ncbi:MAG: universal stress protein [Betaproteobacteria bacterium]|nr:universal stress protein [Betaproteobacteria bacterium]